MNKIKELDSQNNKLIQMKLKVMNLLFGVKLSPGNIVKTKCDFYIVTDSNNLVSLKTGELFTMKYFKTTEIHNFESLYWDAEITIH